MADRTVNLVLKLIDQASAGLAGVERKFKSFFSSVGGGATSVLRAFGSITGALAGFGIVTTLGDVEQIFTKLFSVLGSGIRNAEESQLAFRQLEAAVFDLGKGGEATTKALLDTANALSAASTIQASSILRLEALGVRMGRTREEIEQISAAAVKLAETGFVSLDTAFMGLARSFEGISRGLVMVVPQMRNFTEAQLKAGAAVKLVNDQFAGTQAAKLGTYSGQVQNLSKAWSDFSQSIGSWVVNSPTAIKLLGDISDFLAAITPNVEQLSRKKQLEFFKEDQARRLAEIRKEYDNLAVVLDRIRLVNSIMPDMFALTPGEDLIKRVEAVEKALLRYQKAIFDTQRAIDALDKKPVVSKAIGPEFSSDLKNATDGLRELQQQLQLLRSSEQEKQKLQIEFTAENSLKKVEDQIAEFKAKKITDVFTPEIQAQSIAKLQQSLDVIHAIRVASLDKLAQTTEQAQRASDAKISELQISAMKELDDALLNLQEDSVSKRLALAEKELSRITQLIIEASGVIDQATQDKLDNLAAALRDAAEKSGKAKEEMIGFQGILGQTFATSAGTAINDFTTAIDNIASHTQSAGSALKQFAADTLRLFAKMIEQALILAAVQALIAALTGGTTDVQATGFTAILRQIANLPYHAAGGGIVMGPRLVLAGEKGPEAIVPLDRAAQFGFGGGPNVNVTVNVATNGQSTIDTDAKNGGRQLGKMVTAAVHRVILEQQRPGGLLAPPARTA